jgi:hypothetical protein
MHPITGLVNLFYTQREPYFHANVLVFQGCDTRDNVGFRVEGEKALDEFCGGSRNV